MWPAIIILVIMFFDVLISTALHGEEIKINGCATFLSAIIWLSLLYWAGVFDVFFHHCFPC